MPAEILPVSYLTEYIVNLFRAIIHDDDEASVNLLDLEVTLKNCEKNIKKFIKPSKTRYLVVNSIDNKFEVSNQLKDIQKGQITVCLLRKNEMLKLKQNQSIISQIGLTVLHDSFPSEALQCFPYENTQDDRQEIPVGDSEGERPLIFAHGHRPRHFHNREASGLSEVKCDKDKFQVNLDVQQFKPEELNVKTVDNSVVIEGKHEEKADEHGFIKRHFVRRYVLPENCKQEEVQCQLSSDGVLQIQVARKVDQALPPNHRAVPIEQTGAPAIPQNVTSTAQQHEGGDVQMK